MGTLEKASTEKRENGLRKSPQVHFIFF
jgi:hypothetical protein